MAITAAQLNVKIQTQGAREAQRDLESVGDAVDRQSEHSKVLGSAFLGYGTAIAGAFTYGATAAIDFGEQMANVNSILQVSTEELAAVSQEVLDLSTETGQSATTLAAGLYDIASSGFLGAEGLVVLEVAANAANAGLTDTATSAQAITAALNAYGLTAADAAHVSDVLFQVVNEGVITYEQLAANMGNTLPVASALGVSIEELGAAYARMTLSGVGASQAETQIAALMRAALNPTADLTAAVQAYGYSSVEALIAAEGFTGYLKVLTEASGGSTEQLYALLGTQEAVNAALLLGGENLDAYNASVERMEKSSEGLGATQKALSKQMESTAFSLRLLKTNVQAAFIALGVQLEPVIRAVAKASTGAIKAFLAFSKPIQGLIAGVMAVTGVVALAAGAWALFGTQIAATAGIFLSLLGPIALVVAAVAGLYVAWQTNFLGIQDIASSAFDGIMGALEPVTDFIDRFKAAWDSLGPTMGTFSVLGQQFSMEMASGLGLVERAMAALDIATGGLVTRLREMTLMDVVVNVGNWAMGTLPDIGAWLRDTALPALGDAAVSLGNVLVNIAGWVRGQIADLMPYLQGWLAGAASAVGNAAVSLGSVLVNIADWAQGQIPPLWEKIKFWAAMGATGGAVMLGTIAVSISDWAQGTIPPLFEKIKFWAAMAVAGGAVTLDSVSVSIGEWLDGGWPSLSDSIEGKLGQQTVTLDSVDVVVAGYSAILSGGLSESIAAAIGTNPVLVPIAAALQVTVSAIDLIEFSDIDVIEVIDAGISAAIPLGIIVNLNPKFDLGDIDVAALIKSTIEAAIPGGGIIIDVTAGMNIDWLTGPGKDTNENPAPSFGPGGGRGPFNDMGAGALASVVIPAADTSAFVASIDSAKAHLASLGSGFSGDRGAAGGAAGPAGGAIVIPAADTSAFISSLQTAQSMMQSVMSGMASVASSGMAAIRGAVTSGMAGVTSAVASGMASSRAAVASGVAGMVSVTASGMAAIRGAAAAGMAAFAAAVRSGIASAVAAVRSGIAQMVAAARSGAGAMAGAGRDAIMGLVRGFGSGLGALQAVVNQAKAILAQVPALGNSPWPMMIGAGHDAMDGLMIGLTDRHGRLASTIGDTIGMFATAPTISGGFASTPVRSTGTGSPIYNVYVTVEGNVTTERELTDTIGTTLTERLSDALQRNRVAVGVAT